MAKQNQAKAPEPTKDNTISTDVPVAIPVETPNENNLVNEKEQISLTETTSVPPQIIENHNPYSTANTVIVEEQPQINENPIVQPTIQDSSSLNTGTLIVETDIDGNEVVLGKVEASINQNEPIKPTLTDQVVYQDFSQASTVKIQNEQGVTVNLSGTAAKILKKLDAKTKIVG